MADFLASLNLTRAEPAAPSTARGYASIEDLKTHLRDLIASNVTTTRASHVSTDLQLRDTARFELNTSETDAEAIAGLSNLDPALGGLRSTPVGGSTTEGNQAVRTVDAIETLRNQPHSDPVLQKAVAKHIVAAVGDADSSTWNIREVSRQGQGWTFIYHCRDSAQQWTRQNAKGPEKPVIGEWYYKEPDPVLSNRPAFDCRGTLTISFPRNGRSISVKYDHTPMHQTVAQLQEIFKPPPRPQHPKKTAETKTPRSAKSKNPKEPRPPKTPKTPRTPKTPKTAKDGQAKEKKKRVSTAGDHSKPRKRKKKNDGEAQPANDQESSLFVDSNHPSYATPSATASDTGLGSADQSGTQAASVAANSKLPDVTAAEAARRKDAANRILSEAGIDPATLSADQFSIFANQSPELQKESLAMLLKYGAERLRIVQPTNGAGGQQSSPTASTQPSATGAVTTKELVPQHRNSLPDTTQSASQSPATNGADKTPKSGKMSKSRLVCFQCKERRVKCSKERPTCAECVKESRSCEYPPQPTRASRKKSAAIVVQSEEEEDDDEDDETATQEVPAEDRNSSSNWQMPVADMLGPTVEPTIHNPQPEAPGYYQSATGVPLQHVDDSHGQTDMSAASGLALLQNNTYRSENSIPNPLRQQPHSNSHGIDPAAIHNTRGARPTMHANNGDTTTVAHVTPHQSSANQNSAPLGHRRSVSAAQRERLQHSASPQVVSMQPAQGRASPAQPDHGRTRSRQGQRGQTRTPVNNGTGVGADPPAQAQNPLNNSNPLRDPGNRGAAYTAQATGGARNTAGSDRIPYQPYSHGNVPQQARNNAAMSLPTTMPSTTTTSYSSSPAVNQWGRASATQGTDRSHGAQNSYNHTTSNNQSAINSLNLRGSIRQQQQSGNPRDHQSFGAQQQDSQQTGGHQQNNWFGVNNNANSGGSYNQFGQYWQ